MSEPVNRRRGDRMARLLQLVTLSGTLTLSDAARSLGVSSMTLRRDLAEPGCSVEMRDGQLFSRDRDERRDVDDAEPPYSVERNQSMHFVAKMAAGRNAARLVEPGDTIYVDSGTTMPHLLAALPASLPVTIVCNALNIAIAATRLVRARVHLLGGVLEPASQSFFSEEALLALTRIRVDKAFISAGGISEHVGATSSLFAPIPGKRAAIDHARLSFAVVDSSKLRQVRPALIAPLFRFEQIITDRSVPALDVPAGQVQRDRI